MCLASEHASTQPESAEVVRDYSTPLDVLGCISLYAAQLLSVRSTNTCELLAKNPSSYVLSCALAEYPFSCVCFSKMFLHMFAPAEDHPIKLTSQKPLKSSLQCGDMESCRLRPGVCPVICRFRIVSGWASYASYHYIFPSDIVHRCQSGPTVSCEQGLTRVVLSTTVMCGLWRS